ncbi:MAG: hypothetical protein LBC70_06450, partial [Chitinispirillales bacterium]|nr:hypothetical protein [Chitinispirillales bacterium]
MSRFKRLFGVARRCFWGGAVVLAVAVGAAARPGPRPISSFEELQKIGVDEDYPLDGHYELTQNIDWGGFAESG